MKSLIILSILLIGCAPNERSSDYCTSLYSNREVIVRYYKEGYEKEQLLKTLDSIINARCIDVPIKEE